MLTLSLALLLVNKPAVSAAYVPAATKVALIPVVNASGEAWPEAKLKQAARGDEELHALFEERGFSLVPDADVRSAVDALHVDLADEEQQKRDTLYQIGRKAGADLVAFVVITDVDQRKVTKFLVSSTEGKAKMKMWLLDAKAEKPLLSAKLFEGSSKSGGMLEIGEKGSARKQLAVANGLRDNTKEFFRDYPIVKKVGRSKV